MPSIRFTPTASSAELSFADKLAKDRFQTSKKRSQEAWRLDGSPETRATRKINSQRELSFSKTEFSLDKLQALTSQEKAQFEKNNKDLLYVIDQSKEAQNNLSNRSISSRDDLVQVIAETAVSLLDKDISQDLDVSALRQSPILASMIVLNTGGLKDTLNTDVTSGRLFTLDAPNPQEVVFDTIAEKAANLFETESPLNNTEFFKSNPKAAVYFLDQPDRVSRFQSNIYSDAADEAQKFMDRINSEAYSSILDDFIKGVAANSIQSGVYTTSYFDDMLDFASYIAAAEFVPNIPTPADFLKQFPSYGLSNESLSDALNLDSFVQDVTAYQAKNLLENDNPISFSFLQKNQSFAQLLISNNEFRSSLKDQDVRKELDILFSVEKNNVDVSDSLLSSVRSRFQPKYKDPSPVLSTIT